ncbi:hypothetical protein D1AOALGA4SA_8600 [Olavius algarvensis Delta 1 endosymbiont]|nr:hypothetical protein D1AOALGA4SA_8600 [Olavius algarvensis Delta 1 endosymbiont]
MEFWVSKADNSLILSSDPRHPYKIKSHSVNPSIPTFQYSNIPYGLSNPIGA